MSLGVDLAKFMVKICGITSLQDAQHAIDCGANALGLNFYPGSPRYIDLKKGEWISRKVSGRVLTIGVVVMRPGEDTAVLQEISRGVPTLGAFQLHGLDRESQVPVFEKTCYIATSPERAQAFPNSAIIIDSSWGKGERADWEQLKELHRPFILSGGLAPDNVAAAIQMLSLAGVDVCSGVETSPGVKDPARVEAFVENVRLALAGRRGDSGEKSRA